MLRTILLCSVAVLLLFVAGGASAAGVNYTFLTKCNGDIATYQNTAFSACLYPTGELTLADTLIFPAGTNVSFGSGVCVLQNENYSCDPYNALLVNLLVVEAGAVVTLLNGMIGFHRELLVYGTLVFAEDGAGVGPWDDGYNLPLPLYQLPGFTPAILGSTTPWHHNSSAHRSVVRVFGTLNLNGGSIQTDLVVTLNGVVNGYVWIFGNVRNFGTWNADIGVYWVPYTIFNTYVRAGTQSFTNEASGIWTVGNPCANDYTLDSSQPLCNFYNYGHGSDSYDSRFHNFGHATENSNSRFHNYGHFVSNTYSRFHNYGHFHLNYHSDNISLPIVNTGNMTIYVQHGDKILIPIVNSGTLEVVEAEGATPHASGLFGPFTFEQSVENTGTLILISKRIRVDRFEFQAPFVNAGKLVVHNAGLTMLDDFTSTGEIHAHTSFPDLATFKGETRFDGIVDIQGMDVAMHGTVINRGELTFKGPVMTFNSAVINRGELTYKGPVMTFNSAVVNDGALHCHSQRTQFKAGLHNVGTLEVHHSGSNVLVVEGDVVNEGTLTIGAALATLQQDLFNQGTLLVSDTQPKRSRCFVEGHTYSTGNITVTHAHFTVTSIVQHNADVRLATKSATFTLGAWGTSLDRGVARGYLRRAIAADEVEDDACRANLLALPDPNAGSIAADAPHCFSCSECCPEADLCTSYFGSVYCGGYQIFPYPPQLEQRRFMLAASTLAKMPVQMRHTLTSATFQHPHVFTGAVRVSGPGALTTIDTLEVQGRLLIEDGAEVFSMVDNAKPVAAGAAGHITVQHCSTWYMGNDGTVNSVSPNITVAAGGALVVPQHAAMHLDACHVHVQRGGRVHVDGSLTTGALLAMHVGDDFSYHGRGEVSKKM